jgi:hypothetical protein
MDWWRAYLEAGVVRMRAAGLLRPDTDPEPMALSIFAALQGGLLLMQMTRSIRPLEASPRWSDGGAACGVVATDMKGDLSAALVTWPHPTPYGLTPGRVAADVATGVAEISRFPA